MKGTFTLVLDGRGAVCALPLEEANCPYVIALTKESIQGLGWLRELLQTLQTDEEVLEAEDRELATQATKAVTDVFRFQSKLHMQMHDRDKEIASLKKSLRDAERRCESLQILVGEGGPTS